MSRLSLLALFVVPLSLAAGCTETESSGPTGDLSTEAQLLTGAECTGGAQFNGLWPQISGWNGKAPKSIGANQIFVIAPILGYNDQYSLITQVNWWSGKVTWAAWSLRSQVPQVMATLAVEPGSISSLGGVRQPPGITYPPGTDWGQELMEIGFRNSLPEYH